MQSLEKPNDTRVDMSEMQKGISVDHKERDIAMTVFSNIHDATEAIDPTAERRLVRKIDMMVIPFICITYLITYIDKATLGYAAVFHLKDDLHLHGQQYSWLGISTASPAHPTHSR